MIFKRLCEESHLVSAQSLSKPMSRDEWQPSLAPRRRQWLRMLGLDPLPERTPMEATVTGMLERGSYVVEKLHFQSLPGAYVPGNLYRPAKITKPLPAVLYLCGHGKGKVNPNYQAHPRWFAEHGYVALILDPIQLGEAQGFHHGTYSKAWFHWYSRGYTPAGAEVWNAMRALDYLQERDDVDAGRLGVTGNSGGGAMSWFLAAADERIRCAAPVCQTGSIEQHAVDRTVDSHCDCAFWVNLYRWCTPDIGALIAPRPLLAACGTDDVLWRPYAFRDVMHRIRRQYAALDAAEHCELVEDLSPHGYTPKLRQAVFSWFDRHLRHREEPAADDITDHIEPEENLLVFHGSLPKQDRMREVDRILVQRHPEDSFPPAAAAAENWQGERLRELTALTFSRTRPVAPPRLVDLRAAGRNGPLEGQTWIFGTDDGLELRAHLSLDTEAAPDAPLVVQTGDPNSILAFFCRAPVGRGVHSLTVEVRGTGATSMGPGLYRTARRLYMNVGATLPERQVHDLLAALALVRSKRPVGTVAVYGADEMAPQAVYAALLDPGIDGIVLKNPPVTHDDAFTAEFLAVLQVGDLPANLALAFPRPLAFIPAVPDAYAATAEFYASRKQADRIQTLPSLAEWRPLAPDGGAR